MYLPIFTNNIWSYLLWPPVTEEGAGARKAKILLIRTWYAQIEAYLERFNGGRAEGRLEYT